MKTHGQASAMEICVRVRLERYTTMSASCNTEISESSSLKLFKAL